jgi:hypothetical protein
MRRFLGYLRMAFSAVCGVVCLLLIVLWVRSYWWSDGVGYYGTPRSTTMTSQNGVLVLGYIPEKGRGRWGLHSQPVTDPIDIQMHFAINVYDERATRGDLAVVFPHWLVAMLFALLALVPWLPRRFTLRNILMLTAALAGLLGVFAYFSHW